MKIKIETSNFSPAGSPRVGDVFRVRGGRGARDGHMMVLISQHRTHGDMGFFLVIDRDGNIVGVTSYGMHVIEDWMPVAFVEGLEDIEFVMRSL